MNYILWFSDCSYKNKHLVGGKNASLGELFHLSQELDFKIAHGFAITTQFYKCFLEHNDITEKIKICLDTINADDITQLNETSKYIKDLFKDASYTIEQVEIVTQFYNELCKVYNTDNLSVAVRSSAVAEDLPNASFAGQHDSFLNISGIDTLLVVIKNCFASLFNSRAISYRKTYNITIDQLLISVGIQKMVRSDVGSAGVAFSIDPETGYNKAIVINSSFGIGEIVVNGSVKPDEFSLDKRVLCMFNSDPIIYKTIGDKKTKFIYQEQGGIIEIPTNHEEQIDYSLSNNQAIILAKTVYLLEKKYCELLGKEVGVDVEWAFDGIDKMIYIIQTRPETIHSNITTNKLQKYKMIDKGNIILTGVSVGSKISSGKVKLLNSVSQYKDFNKGDILVTAMTTPDWEPIMKISSGVITNKGGRTCHAAIVARELGINAVVGTTNATEILQNQQDITINCADGEIGKIYDNILKYKIEDLEVDTTKLLPVNLMLNIGSPEKTFGASLIPCSGVGLARLEFIITNYVKIHPNALYDYPNIREDIYKKISNILGNHDDGKWYFIKKLARGIAKIASAFYPNDTIVRLSDFKSNEYRNLIGGELYEPHEENPMLGWRGASRYYSDGYKRGFELECKALHYVRNNMNMTNVAIMIPFCRTPEECKQVIEILKKYGLVRGENGLKIILMCEIPSNVIEAYSFSQYVDGISIGGNDLLQLTLGIDRDSEKITDLSSDKNISYRYMISKAIKDYKQYGVKVGFCGQQPSDSIEFCKFLINEGIDSISVTTDSALNTINQLSTL
jgi:pyruvate,water dikinase